MHNRNAENRPTELTRRDFFAISAGAAATLALAGATARAETAPVPAVPPVPTPLPTPDGLAPLPYDPGALAPIVSANTIGFHYGKHHKGYADNLSRLTAGTEFASMKLEQVVTATAGQADKTAIFNNAAQVWNHDFYWNSLKPNGGGEPPAALKRILEASFGSVDACRKELAAAAMAQFGSGWAWLARDGDKVKVVKTSNADVPFTAGLKPLLTIDVWEHAYYLDYQNRRADYVAAIIDKALNWEFALRNFG